MPPPFVTFDGLILQGKRSQAEALFVSAAPSADSTAARARLLAVDGAFAAAESALRTAARRWPLSARLSGELGLVLGEQGKDGEAEALLRAGAAEAPCLGTRLAYAQLQFRARALNETVVRAGALIADAPWLAAAYRLRGAALAALGKEAAAAPDLARAVQLGPAVEAAWVLLLTCVASRRAFEPVVAAGLVKRGLACHPNSARLKALALEWKVIQ